MVKRPIIKQTIYSLNNIYKFSIITFILFANILALYIFDLAVTGSTYYLTFIISIFLISYYSVNRLETNPNILKNLALIRIINPKSKYLKVNLRWYTFKYPAFFLLFVFYINSIHYDIYRIINEQYSSYGFILLVLILFIFLLTCYLPARYFYSTTRDYIKSRNINPDDYTSDILGFDYEIEDSGITKILLRIAAMYLVVIIIGSGFISLTRTDIKEVYKTPAQISYELEQKRKDTEFQKWLEKNRLPDEDYHYIPGTVSAGTVRSHHYTEQQIQDYRETGTY